MNRVYILTCFKINKVFFGKKNESKRNKKTHKCKYIPVQNTLKMLLYTLQKLFLSEQQGSGLISRKK